MRDALQPVAVWPVVLRAGVAALVAALGQTGEAAEAQGVMAEALERFGPDFRTLMAPLRTSVHEDSVDIRELMRDGYRKAGVLDEG